MRFTKRDVERDAGKAIENIKAMCGTLIILGRPDLAETIGEASQPLQATITRALSQLSGEKVRRL